MVPSLTTAQHDNNGRTPLILLATDKNDLKMLRLLLAVFKATLYTLQDMG
jgi:hypothetical protein